LPVFNYFNDDVVIEKDVMDEKMEGKGSSMFEKNTNKKQ